MCRGHVSRIQVIRDPDAVLEDSQRCKYKVKVVRMEMAEDLV
jgi:hypothetical protein